MKNILAENLLRFGVKNLNEKDKAVLSEALLLEQIQQVDAAVKALNDAASKYKIQFNRSLMYPTVSIQYSAAPYKAGQPFKQGRGGVMRGFDTAVKGDVDLRTYSSNNTGGLPAGEQNRNIYVIDATNKVMTAPIYLRTGIVETGTRDPNFTTLVNNKAGIYGLYGDPFTQYDQTAKGLAAAVKAYYGMFYTTNTTFGGVKGADFRTALQDITTLSPMIDSLITALSGVQLMVKNTGTDGKGRVSAVTIFRS